MSMPSLRSSPWIRGAPTAGWLGSCHGSADEFRAAPILAVDQMYPPAQPSGSRIAGVQAARVAFYQSNGAPR